MPIVALATTEPNDALVRYLEEVGFVVRAVRAPLGAPREGILVWLTDSVDDDRSIVDTVRVWLGAKPRLRAIIVTERPSRLKKAADDARGRILLLPAPVFSWQLVEAIRDEAFTVR